MKQLNNSYYSNYLIWLKSKIIELASLNQNTADLEAIVKHIENTAI